MNSTAQKKTDWKQIFTGLLSASGDLDAEELSAALIARGLHSLTGGDMLEGDEKLRRVNARQLMEAALLPGPMRLRALLEEAEATLAESYPASGIAERAIASMLDTRDQWLMKALGLSAAGLRELARDVERHVGDFDAFLSTRTEALESVSGFKEAALASGLLESSIWYQVPDAVDVEPARDETGVYVERLSDEDLTLVAMGKADEVLDRRVSLAIQTDSRLRRRYDAILADLDAVESAEVIPLSVKSLLQKGIRAARPLPQRIAASDKTQARYEEPRDEDEIFVFVDDSQLFAQKRSGGWVLFLYRTLPRDDDAITGPCVEAVWSAGRLLCAESKPGEIQVRCHGQTEAFRLDILPE